MIGPGRLLSRPGLRFSSVTRVNELPWSRLLRGGFRPTEATVETYDHLVGAFNRLSLSHLHVVRAAGDLTGSSIAALQDTVGYYRTRFEGPLIANLGFDRAAAAAVIESGAADLVSFAKPFISNPDLAVATARLPA